MESPKRVKIKLRDISLVPQIQRSRRKRRLVGPIGSRKPIQVGTTRQLTATLAVIIILKLTLLATISLRPNHNGNFFLLANCHNFKSPGSLEPRDAQEMLSSHHKHQQQAKDDDDDNALERLVGLMMLNFSHERRPSRRRSGMNSNAQRLSESFKKPHAAATSKHLKKLLARPRQVLSSFVPQILSKQMVLKRPHATGQLSKPPREVQSDKRYQNQTALHMSHRHLDTDPGARDHPVVQHARPPAPSEFLQIARPPPLPPFISIPISQYSNVQLQNQQQQQQRPEPGEEPAASSDEEQSAGSASDDGLASEAERGLSQIDQLIKREFETRLNLNERADEWQRQREMANSGGGGGNGEPSDTTLANPLNRAAAGEPTAAPHAVFLSWPPRIHRDEPRRRPAADDERDNRDEWRPTDFPPSLLTAAPLPPTAGTRKSRDSARGNAGALRGPTADIVLGRPDAMRLPPPPSQLPPTTTTTTTTTTASANDALSAFVPSALETIAQLRLNQTGGNQPLMLPSNVPTIPTTTNVHKSHPLSSLDQEQQHISLLNGRPAFGGEQHAHLLPAGGHQLAHSQPAHIRAHHRAVNYLRNSHEPLVNWHIRDEQMSSDLRETLSRLRATKAKIRQLQAELENATPPGLFAAETNKTITRYVDQLNTSQTSEQAKRASQEAAAAATSGRGGLEWFRSWSPPFNRTGGGGGGPAVRAQQSMNVPLGLYYGAGPLATPARLVASALGRTVQHSIGGGPGSLAGIVGAPQPQPTAFSLRPTKIWSATLANPGGDIQSPSQQANAADLMSVRPSSAPILLSSTLRVATGVSEQSATTTTTTVTPSLANRTAANRTMTAGSVPAGPADNPAGTRWQDQSPHGEPLGSQSSSQPADVPLSALRNDNRTLTSGGESDEAASEEDDNDDEPGDERPPSSTDNSSNNNGRRWPAAEGHQQRAQESTPLGVVGAPVRPAPQIPPTSLLAATAVDHHQRQQDELSPPVPRQQHYQAPHKDGDDKRASPLNPKPAATESPIVIVDAPSASVHQAGGVLHVPTPPPPPPLVGLTTRKPGRAKPSARVPIIPAVAAAGESDRSQASLNLNASTSQAFDDFTSEPPARSVPPPNGPASDNFFARLIGDFGNLLFRASGTSANTSDQMIGPIKIGPIDVQSQSPFQVARSLNSRAPFDSSAGNQRQQQVVAVAKLTTERLARNLIVIVSALSLVSLVAVLLFVRLQQARRTRRQNFSDPRCQLNPAAASSQSRSSGADGSDPSSLQDDSLFFDAHQQQHRCSGWRRLGPINFISQASSKGQQDKIILDGTMRNVSLLAKHRQHRPSQQPTMRTADDVPRPLMNRSCCHCVSCSESWLFRDSQQQQRQHGLARDTPLCSSGFYHPAPRGKLPFGAASSVNNMLQRSASNRSLQVVRQDQQQGQVAAVGRDDKQQGNQRAPIGGTRLRMMSAIDESGADRSSSTASDASEWQARMLLNGDCSDEFNDTNNCQPLTSACDNCDHNHQQQHQRARHYQQHQRWHNLGCCPGCNGHLLTPTGQESDQQQQQQQQSSDGALPLESDGASFIVLNGHQHRFRAHNQQQDEMTSAAAAPRDSSARSGDSQQIESAQADKNESACCRTRAGSSGSSSNGIRNKSSECHDKRPMGNCGHRQTIATDEIHNCSRCCDNVSISNHHHHLASAAASVAAAATGKKITTPNTIAAK